MSEPTSTTPQPSEEVKPPEEPPVTAARRLWLLWREGRRPDLREFLAGIEPLPAVQVAEVLAVDQRERWLIGQRIPAEAYLQMLPSSQAGAETVLDVIYGEFRLREELGEAPSLDEYFERFPQYADPLRVQVELHQALGARTCSPAQESTQDHTAASDEPGRQALAGSGQGPGAAAEPAPARLPSAKDPTVAASSQTAGAILSGRYRLTAKLGSGSFGTVFLAYDMELQREVAIKIPHREHLASAARADAYLSEGRALARLDHPGIVPIHDVGRTADGLCYLVSKYVKGTDLARRLRLSPPSLKEAVDIVAGVAEALHHAHQRGLVHRDIKPGNILLEADARPVLADFGLALTDEDYGTGPTFAGTPVYMSPEQARREGHLVDARTDVYSLGVVFYELLTRRLPVRAQERAAILEEIKTVEPRPPRQLDDTIPKELDRICLKALSKRASDRYSTALDLAEDLRHWLDQGTAELPGTSEMPAANRSAGQNRPGARPALEDTLAARVVPRGLRSFETEDADFFLDLLPGPRGRDGLPDSIHFWKTRIEESDPEETFRVGLVYGPSGCGKSSLVKAGLLPRLSSAIASVYVEATPGQTTARLLKALHKRCSGLPDSLGLVETLAYLRRKGDSRGRKVLLVLDQFEQWLHGWQEDANADLVQALRHCDGQHLQSLILVRDDFWMATTRFLRALEIRLVEGRNSAAVDLFDLRHARKVLAEFGQAFGCLPAGADPQTAEQEQFLQQAASGLAQDGKVIPVRLSLFVEMVKGRPWTAATLKEVGGMEGLGVTFLEETLGAATAPPGHRLHQKATRAVLTALLPEPGSDIKGHMRSHHELLDVSGYARQPKEFDDLMHILDAELRLVTPTDPEGKKPGRRTEDERQVSDPSGRYYQLTHDYLVPSLRQWLTRKQRETLPGRAALQLAERTAIWSSRPEKRNLPGWWEWCTTRLLTRRSNWTAQQRRLMRAAARYHAFRGAVAGLLLLFFSVPAAWVAAHRFGSRRAADLVRVLASAEIDEVPEIIQDLAPYRRWAEPLLRQMASEGPADSKQRLHASLALLPEDPGKVEYLCERLLSARPEEFPMARAVIDALDVQPDRAIPLLEQELARTLAPAWKDAPLPADSPAPELDLIRQIENAMGMLEERFAFCQTLPLDQFAAVTEKLARSAYRPIRLRPYALAQGVQVAALWTRDGQEFQMARGVSAAELSRLDEARQKEGYFPVDVTGYLPGGQKGAGTECYCALWVKGDKEGDQFRILAGAQKPFQQGTEDPTGPVTYQALLGRDGQPRYSAVLRTFANPFRMPPDFTFEETGRPAVKAFDLPPDICHLDVSILAADSDRPDLQYNTVQGGNAALKSRVVYDLAPDQHRDRCRELAEQGYRPAAITVAWTGQGPKLVAASVWHRPVTADADKDRLARRQAQAAIALLRLGRPDRLWPLLKGSPDPTRRSYLIHRLSPLGADPAQLIQRLDQETDVSVRRALILGLGEFPQAQLSADARLPLVARLLQTYRDDPDPGIHSAVDWLLRRWQCGSELNNIDREPPGSKIAAGRGMAPPARFWYVNSQGQTLAVIPGPVTFLMGSPYAEPGRWPGEIRHWQQVPRSYAIATKDVTVEQFQQFAAEARPAFAELPPADLEFDSPSPGCPIVWVSWFLAAKYCRWLSEKEKIPPDQMCYPPLEEIKAGMRLPPDYLHRTGYRLPTEAEHEFACRADTETIRFYGVSAELLEKYGWYSGNSPDHSAVVGSLKPNDFGLFDMHGNVWQWCHNWYTDDPNLKISGQVVEDREELAGSGPEQRTLERLLRGGAYITGARFQRSAGRRNSARPEDRSQYIGFRVARTRR